MLILLSIISGLSSLISGITGLGGGVLLIGVLTFFFPFYEAVALHGLCQLASNFSRIYFFYPHIEFRYVKRFALLAVPGVIVGSYITQHINPNYASVILGILIMAVTFGKAKLIEKVIPTNFTLLGFLVPMMSLTTGAVGPMLAPFLLKVNLEKEKFIATKSAMQLITQSLKVIAFASLLKFNYQKYSTELGLMIISIFLGTFIAKKLLPKISSKTLSMVIKGLLFILAAKLILSPIL